MRSACATTGQGDYGGEEKRKEKKCGKRLRNPRNPAEGHVTTLDYLKKE